MPTITKYRLIYDAITIEFPTEDAANTYKINNNIDSDVEQFDEVIDNTVKTNLSIEERIEAATRFGNQLILEFARENIQLGATTTQIADIISTCLPLLLMLKTGSLYTAIDTLNNMTPTDFVTQDRINEFKQKIQAYLGI